MSEGTRRIAAPGCSRSLAALALLVAVDRRLRQRRASSTRTSSPSGPPAALDDEAVSAEIASRVTDDLVLNAERRPDRRPAADRERRRRDRRRQRLPGPLPQPGSATSTARSSSGDANTATLTLADVGEVLRGALAGAAPAARRSRSPAASTSRSPRSSPRRGSPTLAQRRRRRRARSRWILLALGADPRRRRAGRLARPAADRDAARGRGRDLRRGRGGRAERRARDPCSPGSTSRGHATRPTAIWHAFLGDLTTTLLPVRRAAGR